MARWDDEEFNTQLPPDNIKCMTCKHRLSAINVNDMTFDRSKYDVCNEYDRKPFDVLWHGEPCDKYEEE